MRLSDFGKKFTAGSGILQLMDDLGNALNGNEDMLMLGGGNPGHIPEVQKYFREKMESILQNGDEFERVIGNYDSPQGENKFTEALADLLNSEFNWDLKPENIALTNGSQSSFFYLFNMFAGKCPGGVSRKILLPLAPEYIGYADVGISEDLFVSKKPEIDFLDEHMFKYRVDFSNIEIDDSIGAICVSRPTNPTGNVLSDEEISRLSAMAKDNGIPLIIDNAYGTPFPNIIFSDATPVRDQHIILTMSLSKLGLPGTRTGIVIADKPVIDAVSGMNAIFSLAPGSMGAALAYDIIRSGEIIDISRNIIRKYYQDKARKAYDYLAKELEGCDFFIHKPEGALFLWLWLKDFPITTAELYERLKARNVLIVPGHYFFPGLEEDWKHKDECIRITYAQDWETVTKGLTIIAEEVKKAFIPQPA